MDRLLRFQDSRNDFSTIIAVSYPLSTFFSEISEKVQKSQESV